MTFREYLKYCRRHNSSVVSVDQERIQLDLQRQLFFDWQVSDSVWLGGAKLANSKEFFWMNNERVNLRYEQWNREHSKHLDEDKHSRSPARCMKMMGLEGFQVGAWAAVNCEDKNRALCVFTPETDWGGDIQVNWTCDVSG